MPFCQLTFEAPNVEAEFYADLLSELGALSVALEDAKDEPIFEPKIDTTPLWGTTKVIGLYEDGLDIDQLKGLLKMALTETSFQTLRFETIQDENWVLKSREQFKPMRFGDKLWICPSWCEIPEPREGDIKLLLDPGLAFGTGTHPTTQLCLEWLATHPPTGQQVLDYGCGSGILGIAALKLGAKKVLSIDHDPQALLSTHENARLNHLSLQEISVSLPEPAQKIKDMDLILANILLEPLIQLAPLFQAYLAPHGKLILSGILENQIEVVLDTYQPWFQPVQIKKNGDWVLIQY